MSTLEVCLVRHAQSVSNASNVWQGQGDSPLSDMGRTQVEALGRTLSYEQYDLVLSSDLEEVVERFPEQIEALKARRTFAIGGGETWPEVFRRADDSLAALRRRLPDGGRAIVFTHGGIIAALLSGLLGVRARFPWPLGRMRNTGRTTLRFSEDRVELVAHNDDSHVPGELRQHYEPRPDQVVEADREAADTGTADFNSAIKSARKTGAGGVVSVSGTSRQIADLAQRAAGASAHEFRFSEPAQGHSSKLLLSEHHQMLLDYGLPAIQI